MYHQPVSAEPATTSSFSAGCFLRVPQKPELIWSDEAKENNKGHIKVGGASYLHGLLKAVPVPEAKQSE